MRAWAYPIELEKGLKRRIRRFVKQRRDCQDGRIAFYTLGFGDGWDAAIAFATAHRKGG